MGTKGWPGPRNIQQQQGSRARQFGSEPSAVDQPLQNAQNAECCPYAPVMLTAELDCSCSYSTAFRPTRQQNFSQSECSMQEIIFLEMPSISDFKIIQSLIYLIHLFIHSFYCIKGMTKRKPVNIIGLQYTEMCKKLITVLIITFA